MENKIMNAMDFFRVCKGLEDGGMSISGRELQSVTVYSDRVEVLTKSGWLAFPIGQAADGWSEKIFNEKFAQGENGKLKAGVVKTKDIKKEKEIVDDIKPELDKETFEKSQAEKTQNDKL